MAHTSYSVPGETDLATVNTFFLGKPAPIVAERIWNTKANALSYINDTVGSALAGIILRVTDDTTNNGAYLVEKDTTATNGLKLTKFLTGSDSNTWRNIKIKTSASGTATEILSTSSNLPLTLTADSNITLTAVQDSSNNYTGEIKIGASGGGNDTWRNVYTGGTSRVGTGTDTKAINFSAGSNITVSYEAAGTGTGESGSADYFNIKIAADNTATAADDILDGSNSGTEITYKPYTSQQSKLSFDTSTTEPTRTDRLNLNGYLYATYLKVRTERYKSQSAAPRFGLDMNNSDIANANSILFADLSDLGEGLHFRRANTGDAYDTVRGNAGHLYFDINVNMPDGSSAALNTGGSTEEVLHTGNTLWNTTNTNIEIGPKLKLTNGSNVTFTPTTTSGVTTIEISATGGSGTDTKTDQTLISSPASDANNRPLLIAKGTTSSTGTINDETLFAKNLYYTPKVDTLYVGNVETTGNITATGNISGTNITASGKFSGIAQITANQYFSSSKYGIDMQNSDIINANSIFCNDTSEKGEGLHFFRSNNTYDSLRIDNSGLVKFDKGWGYSSGTVTGGTTYDVAISASQTASGITVQTAGTTSDKYYPVQTNPDTGMAVVNVPWSGGSSGGSTVSITVPSPVPTISTSDTTLATVTIDNVQTLIKAKISAAAGGFDPMEGYSLLSGSYSPLEFLCNFFYPVFLDGKSNDISGVTAVRIAEVVDDPADIDGHIPVGAIIIMYACYLTEIGCTSGRLILETYSYGDYWGYIVCQNDSDCYNVDAGSPSQFGSYDVLNENLINLLTFNWNTYIGELPMGINDAVQGAAGLVSNIDEIIGGGPDGFYYYHKYIFTFSDIVTGTMYNSLRTNFYQNILTQDFETAAKEISDNAGTKSGQYFDGMVVTLEHKSCTIADPTDGMHGKTFGWHQPSRPS